LFGAISSLYFVWQRAARSLRFGLVATSLLALASASLVLWSALSSPQHAGLLVPVWHGLEMAAVAALIITVLHAVLQTGIALAEPILVSHYGAMAPSQHVAASMCYLLLILHEMPGVWRRPPARRRLIRRMDYRINWIERALPRGLWLAGVRADMYREVVRRCHEAATALRKLQWRLVDANQRSDYEQLCQELAAATAAVATGDWKLLTSEEQSRTAVSWLIAVLRRLVPAAVLVFTAVALPHLPGVTAGGPAMSSIRVGLVIAAILSLASVDTSSQDRVLAAFSNAHKGGY